MPDLFDDDQKPAQPLRSQSTLATPPPIDSSLVEEMHQNLSEEQRGYLHKERCLSDEVINRYKIGFLERNGDRRIAIPVPDEKGVFRDVLLWLHPKYRKDENSKMLHWGKGYGKPRLFPFDQMEQEELILVEGELDALALISNDLPATTVTAGVSTWPEEASRRFSGKTVTILMDNDKAGEKGAQKRANSLHRQGTKVKVATWPEGRGKGWDVTDELRECGAESVQRILDNAEVEEVEDSLGADVESVMAFPTQFLPCSLCRLVQEGAKAIQCPEDLIAVPLLVMAGAAIGRTYCLRLKKGWDEFGALYAAVVARPGMAKSPAVKLAAHPVYKKAKEWHELNEVALEEYKQQHTAWKRDRTGSEPFQPVLRRLTVSDATVEALAQVIENNPRGILLLRDELSGWAQGMNSYKGGKGSDRQFFLSIWSGTPSPVDRKSQDKPILLSQPFLAITGTIQPDTVRALLHDSKWDDGFLDRILFAYPDPVTSKGWTEDEVSTQMLQAVDELFEKLFSLESGDEVQPMEMDVKAKQLWIEWFNHNQKKTEFVPESLRGVWAKMPSQCARLILIVHCTRWAAGEVNLLDRVDVQSVASGTAMAEYFKSHACRVYGLLNETEEEKTARKVVEWIRRKGNPGTSTRDLCRSRVAGIKKADDAKKIFCLLAEQGRGYWQATGDKTSGQKGRDKFHLK